MRNLNKKLAILAMVMVLCGSLAFPAMAYTYSGAWEPTDGNVNDTSIDVLVGMPSNYSVWLYDWNNPGTAIEFMHQGTTGTTISFTNEGGVWHAKNAIADLGLGNDKWYGLMFKDAATNIFLSYDIIKQFDPGNYTITVGSIITDIFIQNDAQPIPIPPTALLLGSGILGLVAWGWRRGRKED